MGEIKLKHHIPRYEGPRSIENFNDIRGKTWNQIKTIVKDMAHRLDEKTYMYGVAMGLLPDPGKHYREERSERAKALGLGDDEADWYNIIMQETINIIKKHLQLVGFSESDIDANWEYIKENITLVERAGRYKLPIHASYQEVDEEFRKRSALELGLDESASWREIKAVGELIEEVAEQIQVKIKDIKELVGGTRSEEIESALDELGIKWIEDLKSRATRTDTDSQHYDDDFDYDEHDDFDYDYDEHDDLADDNHEEVGRETRNNKGPTRFVPPNDRDR